MTAYLFDACEVQQLIMVKIHIHDSSDIITVFSDPIRNRKELTSFNIAVQSEQVPVCFTLLKRSATSGRLASIRLGLQYK